MHPITFAISAAIGLAAMVLLCANFAHAECLPSPSAVRQAHPGHYPQFSHHLAGHRGEKCWYAQAYRGREYEARLPLPRPNPNWTVAKSPPPAVEDRVTVAFRDIKSDLSRPNPDLYQDPVPRFWLAYDAQQIETLASLPVVHFLGSR